MACKATYMSARGEGAKFRVAPGIQVSKKYDHKNKTTKTKQKKKSLGG